MATKIAIWVRKIIINFESFGATNVDGIEEPVPILLGDNKTFIQLRKDISNIEKIKHINNALDKMKNKSRKSNIFLQWVPNNQILVDGFIKPLPCVSFKMAHGNIKVCDIKKSR